MKHLKSFRLLSRQRRRKTVSLINSRKKEFVISWYLFPWLFCLVFGFVVPEFRLSLEEVTISVRLWCEAAPERSLVINGWRILSAESAIFGELIYCDNLWFFFNISSYSNFLFYNTKTQPDPDFRFVAASEDERSESEKKGNPRKNVRRRKSIHALFRPKTLTNRMPVTGFQHSCACM